MKYVLSSLTLIILLNVSGCRTPRATSVLARVGEAELTLEEAKSHIDTTRGSVVHQLHEYVTYWVNVELVYQEAKRHGADQSGRLRLQLEDIKRQLVNRSYLEEQVFSNHDTASEQTLHDYFTSHSSEFFVREDIMKLNIAVFNDRTRASAFAAAISRGASWNTLTEDALQDTLPGGVVSITANQYYTQHTLFPPELWKVASGLNLNEVTFPVKTAQGYYVLQALSHAKQGSPADFELARDEVRQRALVEKQEKQYAEFIGTLRKRYDVEIFMTAETSKDTMQTGTNE